MDFWKNGENQIYDNLEFSTESQERIVEEILKKGSESSENNKSELDVKRSQIMKKKEYGDILKKVAVASFSLIASGAMIAGVIYYSNNNGDGNKFVNKNIEKTSERLTEKETETIVKDTEKITEETEFVEEESVGEVVQEGNGYEYILEPQFNSFKFGDYVVNTKIVDGETGKYKIEVENNLDKSKTTVDEFIVPGYYKMIGDIYKYGNTLYYFDTYGLKSFDADNLKSSYVAKFEKELTENFMPNIVKMDENYIYITGQKIYPNEKSYDSEDWSGTEYYSFVLNRKNKKIKFYKNRKIEDFIDDKYVITSEVPKYKYDPPGHPGERPQYVEKLDGGKITEIIYLGERSECDFYYGGLNYSKDGRKLYYENHEKTDKKGFTDFSETTIMCYDMDKNEIKKISTISYKDLGVTEQDIFAVKATDDYAVFWYHDDKVDEPGNNSAKKYFYKSKKVEDVEY